ncbi:hypothetical protein CWI38_0918p0020 [Hamiltosporidium tvaerminnensis]|uniref:Uncharacterized protein n=1 Tax=Hamiltosporidium tvaerminnensis TaxID=1176355 RepID=A0A4V2JXJ5_9MICR|nr:hypothetical protein CWI38_0918p0020 [Hamiltosporidium tvaerminnensis]
MEDQDCKICTRNEFVLGPQTPNNLDLLCNKCREHNKKLFKRENFIKRYFYLYKVTLGISIMNTIEAWITHIIFLLMLYSCIVQGYRFIQSILYGAIDHYKANIAYSTLGFPEKSKEILTRRAAILKVEKEFSRCSTCKIIRRKLHSKLYNIRKIWLVFSHSTRWVKKKSVRPLMKQMYSEEERVFTNTKILGHGYTRRRKEVIRNYRPDIFILDKRKNILILIEVGITFQNSLQIYDLLTNELGLIYMCSVYLIPVCDNLGGYYSKSLIMQNIHSFIVLKQTVETIYRNPRRTILSLKQATNDEDGNTMLNINERLDLEEETIVVQKVEANAVNWKNGFNREIMEKNKRKVKSIRTIKVSRRDEKDK